MKKFILATLTLLGLFTALPVSAAGAPDVSEADNGSYVFLNKQGSPTEMFMRLSKPGGKWIVEIKKPGGNWQNTICDQGCDYGKSTEQEIQRYFPSDWRANSDIACIQNMTQAFCHYNDKGSPQHVAYVVISLATGRPIPLFLRRIVQLENPLLSR